MKLSSSTIDLWKKKFDHALPGLLEALTRRETCVFLIGAAIFDLYQTEEWIERFSRQTGDADFTLEYMGDPREYHLLCQELKGLGYRQDEEHPYRYHPEKVTVGTYAYIDLLTFTTDPNMAGNAKSVMGVGEDFNFDGMEYVKLKPILFKDNILLPNPLALLFLKAKSYQHNPDRGKDLADIVELVMRLGQNKVMDELKLIADEVEGKEAIAFLNSLLGHLVDDDRPQWDLDTIKEDLAERLIEEEFGEGSIVNGLDFFRRKLLEL